MKLRVSEAAKLLQAGGVVAFPTETVYGLGAVLRSPRAVRRIFAVKGRPSDNPLIVHVSSLSQFRLLTRNAPASAFRLARKFWPGPLTLVCRKSRKVPGTVTAGLNTVAVRMPNHPVALALIRKLKEPLAAPSANRSGRPSPTRYGHVVRELGGRVDGILDGGASKVGLESTVVDLSSRPPRLLRPGSVSAETLRGYLPDLEVAGRLKKSGAAPSPGMKHRHYRPDCRVLEAAPENWEALCARWGKKAVKLGAIACRRRLVRTPNLVFAKISHKNGADYARKLYHHFYEAEKKGVQVLIVETLPARGIGHAFRDRLRRASGSRG